MSTTAPAIELIHVEASASGHAPLRGVNFSVPRSSIGVIAGPAGAGKSHCVKLISGLARPSLGAVLVGGREVSRARGRGLKRLQRQMSVMLQGGVDYGLGLFDAATVAENVALPLRERRRLEGRELQARTDEYLGKLGLRDRAEEPASSLDPQRRKLLALARALSLRSPIVILDDFERGIGRLDLLIDLIREEQSSFGGTYLLATRDRDLARSIGERMISFDAGQVVEETDIGFRPEAVSSLAAALRR